MVQRRKLRQEAEKILNFICITNMRLPHHITVRINDWNPSEEWIKKAKGFLCKKLSFTEEELDSFIQEYLETYPHDSICSLKHGERDRKRPRNYKAYNSRITLKT